MNKIIYPSEIDLLIKKLKENREKIVLAGGCFDILHSGHIAFLEKAKQEGTKLIVLLESDENVKRLKGNNRPINKQLERAKILSSVIFVDFIILLSEMKNDKDYAKLVDQIKPDVIATTSDDLYVKEKEKQAKEVGAKIVKVIKRIENKSTTKFASFIK